MHLNYVASRHDLCKESHKNPNLESFKLLTFNNLVDRDTVKSYHQSVRPRKCSQFLSKRLNRDDLTIKAVQIYIRAFDTSTSLSDFSSCVLLQSFKVTRTDGKCRSVFASVAWTSRSACARVMFQGDGWPGAPVDWDWALTKRACACAARVPSPATWETLRHVCTLQYFAKQLIPRS